MVDFKRRSFIKTTASAAMIPALPLSLGTALSLSGCSSPTDTKHSYIKQFVQPKYLSTVFLWTDIMLQAIRNKSYTPPQATRALAMGHTAGFLAVNGITQQYNTPYSLPSAPQGADPEIAYGVAVSYAISDAFQALFTFDRIRFLDSFPDSDAKSVSIKWGRKVADYIIKLRTYDGAEPHRSDNYLGRYPRNPTALKWTPTGPLYDAPPGPRFVTYERGLHPGWGAIKPWTMKDKSSFRASEFLDPKSPEFAQQYDEVLALGAHDSAIRTEDQTEIAFFWEDGPGGLTPPGHWQLIAMNLIQDKQWSITEQAKTFALLSAGQADAAITTWDSKYHYDIVRPETAIRYRADELGNSRIQGKGDSSWKSLIFTPGFPAYTSGHSCFSAVSARMIANCLGTDNVTFSTVSPDKVVWPKRLKNIRRSWRSVWQAAEENGASRIYGGVHWRHDNSEGLAVGKRLADYTFKNAFSRRG
jgi:hypothetical protein